MMALLYYIIKVIVCSGCFYLYYQLALKNKVFHQWNRFYLLCVALLSLFLPLIQIIILQRAEEAGKAIQLLHVVQSANSYLEEITISNHTGFSSELWMLIGYAFGSMILLRSLLISLLKIYTLIQRHHTCWLHQIRFINTNEPGTPFSFFNFIFWNESIPLQSETGQQIFQHELVHVQEKHTLDKLFIQGVLILFWCNPFFWLIRRELQFIHEFIADKKAVGADGATAFAAMILQTTYPKQYSYITNPFFQTAIKRRIKMLAKIQNPRRAYISRIIALPVIALIAFAFTVRTKETKAPLLQLEKEIVVVIDAGHGLVDGKHSGALGGHVYEDDIVLKLAKEIEQENGNDKIKVVLSRGNENNLGLKERAAFAQSVKADLFISLHLGAMPDGIGYKTTNGYEDGIGIYVSNKNTSYQLQSELFGSALQKQLQSAYKTYPNLIKQTRGVWLLDQAYCPSVLVECGFITNDKDRSFITQQKNQKLVAQKILGAIQQYAFQSQPRATKDTVPENIKPLALQGVNDSDNYSNTKKGQPHHTGQRPLYIVDGKEISTEQLNKINQNNIATINILKDSFSIIKYGAKAKNGAVEIFMKPGTDAFTQSKQNGEWGFDHNTQLIGTRNDSGTNITIKRGNTRITVGPNDPSLTSAERPASVDIGEWRKFLEKTLGPVGEEMAKKGAPTGTYTVDVKFIINKDGSTSNFEIVKDPGYGLGEKVLAIMPGGPKWNPAKQNNKLVPSYHTQPINIIIAEQ